MNPFTERGRITDPRHFAGRWREMAMISEWLEKRRPILIAGSSGIGKSSLLTHVSQAAATVLERPDLTSRYLDLAMLPDAATCYRLIIESLGGRGDSIAALEVALLQYDGPVLLCLDNADQAIAAGWGGELLTRLARIARSSARALSGVTAGLGITDLMLVVAVQGAAPQLSERFEALTLGAVGPAEIRLVADAYLDDSNVAFSANELRDLNRLSAGHPAYLQRAAFHLFRAHTQPGYDWKAAYLDEARDQPVPGAPLPPAVFSGAAAEPSQTVISRGTAEQRTRSAPPPQSLGGIGELVAAILPVILALLVWQIAGSLFAAGVVLVLGFAVGIFVVRSQSR